MKTIFESITVLILLAITLSVIFGAYALGGYESYQLRMELESARRGNATLQAQAINAHSALQRSETARAELIGQIDDVNESAHAQGIYEGCLQWSNKTEPECYQYAHEQTTP